MKLSPSERLIIELLCDIANKKPSDYDTNFISKAISSQQEWAIPIKYQCLDDGSPKPLFVSEVYAILETYRWISDTIQSTGISKDDLKKMVVDNSTAPITFDGFDGNNESEHLSAARMLIDDLGLYQEQSGKANNTHAPRRDAYIKVSNAYIKELKAAGNYTLQHTIENLVAVLNKGSKLQMDIVELSALWHRG